MLLSQADKNMRDSGAGITESTSKKKVKTRLTVGKCIKLTVLTERSVAYIKQASTYIGFFPALEEEMMEKMQTADIVRGR